MAIQLLGAAVDVLDEPQKIELKQAYMAALAEGRMPEGLPLDPYDAIVPLLVDKCGDRVRPAGKLNIPGWLTPRPSVDDSPLVTPDRYRAFIDRETIATYSEQCAQWVRNLYPPDIPGLIAVDHALSAGPLTALAEQPGSDNLTVVILDSHFDAIPAPLRAPPGVTVPDSGLRNCGSFLAALLEEEIIVPENLFVVGAADMPRKGVTQDYADAYNAWLDKGVTVIAPEERPETLSRRLEVMLKNHPAQYLYVSLDADVGACNGMGAVRFMDHVGLDSATVMSLAQTLNRRLMSGAVTLAGLDVAEVDVHLLGLPDASGAIDQTDVMCANFVQTLLAT